MVEKTVDTKQKNNIRNDQYKGKDNCVIDLENKPLWSKKCQERFLQEDEINSRCICTWSEEIKTIVKKA